jgi:hypothetical protein
LKDGTEESGATTGSSSGSERAIAVIEQASGLVDLVTLGHLADDETVDAVAGKDQRSAAGVAQKPLLPVRARSGRCTAAFPASQTRVIALSCRWNEICCT